MLFPYWKPWGLWEDLVERDIGHEDVQTLSNQSYSNISLKSKDCYNTSKSSIHKDSISYMILSYYFDNLILSFRTTYIDDAYLYSQKSFFIISLKLSPLRYTF